MSDSGLYYQLNKYLGSNSKLAAFYDFTNVDYNADGSGPYTGLVFNSSIAGNSSLSDLYLLNITGSTTGSVESQLTGLFNTGYLNLTKTNCEIQNINLDIKDFSILVDFEFFGQISDGILFGSFEKSTENINGINYISSSGFNVGVTSRGHLFLQNYNEEGDSVQILQNVELSKRNIIGITSYGDSIVLSRFDYLNDKIDSQEFNVDSNYLANVSSIYFGGSNEYFRSNIIQDRTFSGYINEMAIFSGACSTNFLKNIGSGIIGDYYYNPPSEIVSNRITGYQETIVYETGITGYDYQTTGTLSITVDRDKFVGYYTENSTQSKTEGERYYKYYSFNNGTYTTFYKEELGFLHPDSGYIYYPTGENAYATLGLQNISDSIATYIETTGIIQDTTSINLYGRVAQTGLLKTISGVISTPLTENYSTFSEGDSGIYLSGDSTNLKKNYIYFLGERL